MQQLPQFATTEFGIYVHFPLCERRCGYCDFAITTAADFDHVAYGRQVLLELEHKSPDYLHNELRSIYFGGGTPSMWPAEQIARVVSKANATWSAHHDFEVTIEANPNDVTPARAAAWRDAGVNRVSLGVQAMDDATLKRLTRSHTPEQVQGAVAALRNAGFDNISCDLIVGLAGQGPEQHVARVDAIVALRPEHVSVYQLTLARGSQLWRDGERPVDDDASADLYQVTYQRLSDAGFEHYEISNFARPGYASRHNMLTWAGQPYLAVGAAGHGLLWSETRNIRSINPPPKRYLGATPEPGRPAKLAGTRVFELEPQTARFEALMLALRTAQGLHRASYRQRFGTDAAEDFSQSLKPLIEAALVQIDRERIFPTPRGMLLADSVAEQLLPP